MLVISMPDLPYREISQGEAMMLPLESNWVRSSATGMACPWRCLSRGLGSKESTWDTPPDM
jgi:hypothetical protein